MVTAPSQSQVGPRDHGAIDSVRATRREYRCQCGHALRVFGTGRHRVYFEAANAALDDPVMDHACPDCGRALPEKNAQ